jgi:hypothetical protein
VHRNDAQGQAFDPNFGHDGPARLKRWQINMIVTQDFCIAADEDGIAVPTDTMITQAEFDRLVRRSMENKFGRQRRSPRAKAPISLLQCDNVSVDFAQHINDARGPPQPVKPDAPMDIIAGDL